MSVVGKARTGKSYLIEKINEPDSTFNHKIKPKIILAQYKNDAGIIGATIE